MDMHAILIRSAHLWLVIGIGKGNPMIETRLVPLKHHLNTRPRPAYIYVHKQVSRLQNSRRTKLNLLPANVRIANTRNRQQCRSKPTRSGRAITTHVYTTNTATPNSIQSFEHEHFQTEAVYSTENGLFVLTVLLAQLDPQLLDSYPMLQTAVAVGGRGFFFSCYFFFQIGRAHV